MLIMIEDLKDRRTGGLVELECFPQSVFIVSLHYFSEDNVD